MSHYFSILIRLIKQFLSKNELKTILLAKDKIARRWIDRLLLSCFSEAE